MKKIVALLFMLFIVLFAKGQVITDSLYLHLYNYQVIKGELKPGLDLNELGNSFNIENLIDGINTETFSIFKFYHLEYEEPLTSFLIIEKDNIEIFDIQSFDVLIEKILEVSSINDKSKALCIKEILKMLRKYYEVVDMERLVIQKNFGKYHYFIPVMNIKNLKRYH